VSAECRLAFDPLANGPAARVVSAHTTRSPPDLSQVHAHCAPSPARAPRRRQARQRHEHPDDRDDREQFNQRWNAEKEFRSRYVAARFMGTNPSVPLSGEKRQAWKKWTRAKERQGEEAKNATPPGEPGVPDGDRLAPVSPAILCVATASIFT